MIKKICLHSKKQHKTIMNYHTHSKQIQSLLHNGFSERVNNKGILKKQKTYNTGIYMLSRIKDDHKFKLGCSYGKSGIPNRIKRQYKIAYSGYNEMWLHYVIVCPNARVNKKPFALILEKLLLETIGNKDPASYSKEVLLMLNSEQLHRLVFKVLRTNRHLWTHIVKFDIDGWTILGNNDIMNFDIKEKTMNTTIINKTNNVAVVPRMYSEDEYDALDSLMSIKTIRKRRSTRRKTLPARFKDYVMTR